MKAVILKMKNLYILFFTLLLVSCDEKVNSCDFYSANHEILNQIKNNKVKKVSVFVIDTINYKKSKIREEIYNDSGFPVLRKYFTDDKIYKYEKLAYYNENNLLKEIYVGKQLDSLNLVYNQELNDESEIITYYKNDKKLNTEIFFNDSKGRNISKKMFDSDSILVEILKFEWSYKNGNSIVKSTKFDSNNKELSKKIFVYDGCKLIESVLIEKKDTIEEEKLKYNSYNLLIYSEVINFKDSTKSELHIKYSKNNLIEKQIRIFDGKYYVDKEIQVYEYEFN